MGRKVRVNGTEYDGSIILKIAGEEFSGPEEITYSDKVERALTYGMTGRNRKPRGRTAGKYTPDETTMKGPKKGMKEIRQKLKALGGGVVTRPEFEVTVAYIDENGESTTDVLEQCKVASHKAGANTTGTDPASEEWTLSIMGIKWDGDSTLYQPNP
jgi:hypothetical protein